MPSRKSRKTNKTIKKKPKQLELSTFQQNVIKKLKQVKSKEANIWVQKTINSVLNEALERQLEEKKNENLKKRRSQRGKSQPASGDGQSQPSCSKAVTNNKEGEDMGEDIADEEFQSSVVPYEPTRSGVQHLQRNQDPFGYYYSANAPFQDPFYGYGGVYVNGRYPYPIGNIVLPEPYDLPYAENDGYFPVNAPSQLQSTGYFNNVPFENLENRIIQSVLPVYNPLPGEETPMFYDGLGSVQVHDSFRIGGPVVEPAINVIVSPLLGYPPQTAMESIPNHQNRNMSVGHTSSNTMSVNTPEEPNNLSRERHEDQEPVSMDEADENGEYDPESPDFPFHKN